MHVIGKFPSRIVPQILEDIEEAGQMAYLTTLVKNVRSSKDIVPFCSSTNSAERTTEKAPDHRIVQKMKA